MWLLLCVLVAAKVQLFLRTPAQLVFLGAKGPLDASLVLLSTTADPLQWTDATRALMDKGQVLVRDTAGKTVTAKASDATDLYFRLLPEATDKLYVWRDGALRPLNLQRGLGKERLTLVPTAAGAADDEVDADEMDAAQDGGGGPQKRYIQCGDRAGTLGSPEGASCHVGPAVTGSSRAVVLKRWNRRSYTPLESRV